MPLAIYKDLCVGATDPLLVGRFWAGALGLELHEQEAGDTYLTGPTPRHTIWVTKVRGPKTVKQRLHLDVNVAAVAELEALGATVVDADSFGWTVMADPDDNEFCAFAS
ncbi:MAG: VOC family protein [Nocardioides sp.]